MWWSDSTAWSSNRCITSLATEIKVEENKHKQRVVVIVSLLSNDWWRFYDINTLDGPDISGAENAVALKHMIEHFMLLYKINIHCEQNKESYTEDTFR